MPIQISALEYLHQIQREVSDCVYIFKLQHIRKYQIMSMSNEDKELFQKFERVYLYVFNQYQAQQLSEGDILGVYGYFLQTIKKFKRRLENNSKHFETDYNSFIAKYTNSEIKLINPLQGELKFEKTNYMKKFEYEKLLDSNMQHHIYTNRELCDYSIDIFEHLNVFQAFSIQKESMKQLVYEISKNYNIIPYHNFTHAFQLFQLLFSCYEQSQLREFVNQIEIFAALLSGLAHDLNHKGVNNGYKIKKSQKQNILTSEQAVLENMHCATFFNILHLNSHLNIIDSFTDNDKTLIKRLIITSILATDFSKHNKLVAKLTKRVEATNKAKIIADNGEELNELTNYLRLNKENVEDRRLVLNIFVHACDISNPLLNFETYMNWSFLLAQEFQDQTLREESKGLEVTGFLKYKDLSNYYNGQIFFAKQMVLPLWKPIGQLFPPLKYLPDQLERNLTRLEEEKLQAQKIL